MRQLFVKIDLTNIMAQSRNEEELLHVWIEWHNKSGGPIKQIYKQFFYLSNEAAIINSTVSVLFTGIELIFKCIPSFFF